MDGAVGKVIIVFLFSILSVGCGTVTISPEGKTYHYTSVPDYVEQKQFYLWGLVPTHEVDVKTVCKGKSAKQMQAQHTFKDSALTLITLGIYSPRTAKVWCES